VTFVGVGFCWKVTEQKTTAGDPHAHLPLILGNHSNPSSIRREREGTLRDPKGTPPHVRPDGHYPIRGRRKNETEIPSAPQGSNMDSGEGETQWFDPKPTSAALPPPPPSPSREDDAN